MFDQFLHIGHFSHSVLVTEHDFELRISKFQFSRNFWDFGKLSGNSKTLTIFEKWNIFSTQFWLLISIFYLKLVHFAIFCISYDFLEISKFPNPRFQKILQYEHFLQNLQVLSEKSKSVTQIEWEKCSTFQKWSKFVNFQTISRNSRKFLENWNFEILSSKSCSVTKTE